MTTVSMIEALQRLLPYCHKDPHKVTVRLDLQGPDPNAQPLGLVLSKPIDRTDGRDV